MTDRLAIIVLLVALVLFVALDHSRRPAPDHERLEIWRATDSSGGACAPCGAVCDDSK